MNFGSPHIISLLFAIIVASAVWGYSVFYLQRDFLVQNVTVCDPAAESCFVWCEGGVCEEDYYKKIVKRAVDIPLCNPLKEDCAPIVCAAGEDTCKVILCSSDTVEAGEQCVTGDQTVAE